MTIQNDFSSEGRRKHKMKPVVSFIPNVKIIFICRKSFSNIFFVIAAAFGFGSHYDANQSLHS